MLHPKYNSGYEVSSQSQEKKKMHWKTGYSSCTAYRTIFQLQKYIHFEISSFGTWQNRKESTVQPLGKLKIFRFLYYEG